MADIKFVSYDGHYPNLCSGTLVLNIDGMNITFPKDCLHSGGYIIFDDDWNADVSEGDWDIYDEDIPTAYRHLKNEIIEVVNENVPHGCCGGCI